VAHGHLEAWRSSPLFPAAVPCLTSSGFPVCREPKLLGRRLSVAVAVEPLGTHCSEGLIHVFRVLARRDLPTLTAAMLSGFGLCFVALSHQQRAEPRAA